MRWFIRGDRVRPRYVRYIVLYVGSHRSQSLQGVFTQLTRKLGVKNISLVELYDIEPWATDHLLPHGLIFCYLWRKDIHRPVEFENPEQVWFAMF